MTARILIVEDDVPVREGLCELLTGEGCEVFEASDVRSAEAALAAEGFDLIILDNLLPGGSGLELCKSLRSREVLTPILFLTACDDEMQTVSALDAGADDYVTKPFRLRELTSRIKALLRRTSSPFFSSDGLSVDRENFTVKRNGKNVYVTPTEFQILNLLMKKNGAIVTRETLLRNVWDDSGSFIDDNTLSVHVSRLREKIGAARIATVRGIGYRWEG